MSHPGVVDSSLQPHRPDSAISGLARQALQGPCRSAAILLSLSLALAACSKPPSSARTATPVDAEQRPNLLLLLTDDQRWDTLGATGNAVIRTPNLDRLAAEAMLFRNAFVTASVCSVSRASIVSGQLPQHHGIRDFARMFSAEALQLTYPGLLRKAGYYTGFIGKWGIGANHEPNLDVAREVFDYWAGAGKKTQYWHRRSCRYVTHDGKDFDSSAACDCPADLGARVRADRRADKTSIDAIHLSTAIIPDKVQRFLDSRDPNKPFSLSVSFKAPHGPARDWASRYEDDYHDLEMPVSATATLAHADLKPGFLRQSESNRGRAMLRDRGTDSKLQQQLRDYSRLITGLDDAVGQIRDALSKRRLAESTVILFTSDNGLLQGSHGLWGKWLMYEESIRVPMILYDPRLPAGLRGKTCDEMVLNVDIAPTFLALAGLPTPTYMQGQSMVPLLSQPASTFREVWFYEHHFQPGGRRIEPSEGVRTRQHKYIRYIDQEPPYEELYDLQADPSETRNLAGHPQHQDRLAKLRRHYFELRGKQ